MIKKLTSFASSLKSSIRMGKAPIFLKHRAKDAYGSFKKKSLSVKNKISNYARKNPNKTVIGGALAFGGITTAIDGKSTQNMKIEMQKISKERKNRVISSKEIDTRLKKARQSKREFTWI